MFNLQWCDFTIFYDYLSLSSLNQLVEKQIGIASIKSCPRAFTVVIVVPLLSLYHCHIVPVHQTSNMIYNSNQFIPLPFYHLKLLKVNRRIDFLSVNNVSVATVSSVIESLQVNDQKLRSSIQLHCLLSQFVIFTHIAVPCIFLSQFLWLRKTFNQIMYTQFISHFFHQLISLSFVFWVLNIKF